MKMRFTRYLLRILDNRLHMILNTIGLWLLLSSYLGKFWSGMISISLNMGAEVLRFTLTVPIAIGLLFIFGFWKTTLYFLIPHFGIFLCFQAALIYAVTITSDRSKNSKEKTKLLTEYNCIIRDHQQRAEKAFGFFKKSPPPVSQGSKELWSEIEVYDIEKYQKCFSEMLLSVSEFEETGFPDSFSDQKCAELNEIEIRHAQESQLEHLYIRTFFFLYLEADPKTRVNRREDWVLNVMRWTSLPDIYNQEVAHPPAKETLSMIKRHLYQ